MALLDHKPASDSLERELCAGERFFRAGDSGPVWQVVKGLLRLEMEEPSGTGLVHLAQTGDLIGAESVLSQPYTFGATAVVASQLRRVDLDTEAHRVLVLATALKQGQQRAAEVMRLREGSVAQRLDHLLDLIQRTTGEDIVDVRQRRLPTLRDIATILNAAPESVCRNLTQRLGRRTMLGIAKGVHRSNLVPIVSRASKSAALQP